MKQTVQEHDFLDAFRQYGRADQFTRAGLIALFDYLEEYEKDAGEELELDVIALCCDWSEYPTALEAMRDHVGGEAATDEELNATEDSTEDEAPFLQHLVGDDLKERAALEWLNDQTTVIEFDGGVIVGAF
ncbi:MAG: hypothetical protein WC565_07260 [Parcubacteria group bacterium]|jgi:hypothetical protein